jgi:O-antigen/teichoic acid export membrane protein
LAVALALAANNGSGYLLTVLAARLLTPALFGELSSLLALLVVCVVPAMGVQTVLALRVAAGGTNRAGLVGLGLFTSLLTVAVVLAAVPLLALLLHLPDARAGVWLALALGPLTIIGMWHGLLQGSRRFGLLAAMVALEGLGKIGGTLGGLLLGRTSAAALAGTAAGSLVVALIGWVLCGRPRPGRLRAGALIEVGHTVQAMLALVLLVNLDLVLARHSLPAHQAGEYAVGAVITKIAYWLPQAVGVLLLPRLAQRDGRRRAVALALAACATIDAVFVLGTVLFDPLLRALVGGAHYAADPLALWPFAVTGSLLAVVQILLYARIADGDRRAAVLLWAAVALEIGLVVVRLHGTITEIVSAAVVSVAALAVTAVALERRARPAR